MSENDFECFASTGVNTPATMSQIDASPERVWVRYSGSKLSPRCWRGRSCRRRPRKRYGIPLLPTLACGYLWPSVRSWAGNPDPAILRLAISSLILTLDDQAEAGRRWLKLQNHMRIRAACVLRGGSRRRRNLRRANANRDRARRVAAISVLVDGDQAVPVSFAGAHVKIGELARIAGERIADYNSKIGLAPGTQHLRPALSSPRAMQEQSPAELRPRHRSNR